MKVFASRAGVEGTGTDPSIHGKGDSMQGLINTLVGGAAVVFALGGCVTIPVPPTDSSTCTADLPSDGSQTKQVKVRLQPSDSSKPIVRYCVSMIVTYGPGAKTQTVLLADVLDPAAKAIQVTKYLQPSPISSVIFYWREGPRGNGARRAFLLNGPPDGTDWNAIYLGWNVLGFDTDVYEYETSGFLTLP